MPLRLVIDPTTRPAAFGLSAALEARRLGARFMHLPATFDLAADPDAQQYVHAAGGLGPSGLYFAERILGCPIEAAATIADILSAARHADVVVAIHPAFGQAAGPLREAAKAARIDTREPIMAGHEQADMDGPIAPAAGHSSKTICLLGREHDHRNVYPAALASLRDAAAAQALDITIRFVDPRETDGTAFADAAGILLPGGSDMGNVPGQIRAARYAIDHGVAILGLCLGMQTMATAFAQTILGDGMVNLAEADPTVRTKSFVAMATSLAGNEPLPDHRTGDATVDIVHGTRLAVLIGTPTMRVRCNHRFHLAPSLRPVLEQAGLVVSATSFDGRVVDAIEWPAHAFFIGLQGHPELSATAGAPHPIFSAFLDAASGAF